MVSQINSDKRTEKYMFMLSIEFKYKNYSIIKNENYIAQNPTGLISNTIYQGRLFIQSNTF